MVCVASDNTFGMWGEGGCKDVWKSGTGRIEACRREGGGKRGEGGVAIHGMVCIKYEVKWGGNAPARSRGAAHPCHTQPSAVHHSLPPIIPITPAPHTRTSYLTSIFDAHRSHERLPP